MQPAPVPSDSNDARHSDCILRFRNVIDSGEGRMTRERHAILRTICSTQSHFTIESILNRMREEGLQISLATAYRTLPLLEEAGIIRRVSHFQRAPGGAPLYEHVLGTGHHDHLVCSRCGLVLEFVDPGIEALQQVVAQTRGFSLERHHLELVGLCPDCQVAPAQGATST